MTPMTNLIVAPHISLWPKTSAKIPSKIQMSAATAATPTAESVSEAKPTISAILATKIQKLIPTERTPRRPAVIRRGHEPRGEFVPPQLTPSLLNGHPLGERANQSGKLLRKFERKCSAQGHTVLVG
jgi:hypothetical protein